jgi:hypothetical protein
VANLSIKKDCYFASNDLRTGGAGGLRVVAGTTAAFAFPARTAWVLVGNGVIRGKACEEEREGGGGYSFRRVAAQ